MLQDYLQQYPPPSQAIAYSNIKAMAQKLDAFFPQMNNDIEYGLFEDVMDSYYLDS